MRRAFPAGSLTAGSRWSTRASREQTGRALSVAMYAKYFAPRYSGAGRQALALAGALREQGMRVSFLTEATAAHPRPYAVDGFEVHPFVPATDGVSLQPARSLRLLRALAAGGERPAIFHAHGAYPEASLMGLSSRLLGIPSVLKVTMHRSDADCGSRLIGRIHRELLRRQSAIVAISSDIRDELLELGIARERIREIPNGVDTTRFRPASPDARRRARRELGLDPEVPVALFIGIMNERKNILWLLDQWESWRRRSGSPWTLLLVGPGSQHPGDGLRQRLERLGRVPDTGARWIGTLPDPVRAYAAADLLILPSIAEGLANVLLEAMAAGVPTLVTEVSGSRDALGVSENAGIRFHAGDGEAFAAGLQSLATNGARRERMGLAARARAERLYSLDSVARRYADLYRKLSRREAGFRPRPSVG